jgi:hypothetical protein
MTDEPGCTDSLVAGNSRSLFALQCFNSSFKFINAESPPLHRAPPQKSENSYYDSQDRQHQSRRPLIKPGHGNLLSVRLNAEMKGDYSQPALIPGRYLEQVDLPSTYLGPVPHLSLSSTELSRAKAYSRSAGRLGIRVFLNRCPRTPINQP